MTKVHEIVGRVIFGIRRSQNFLPGADCELSVILLWSPADISRTLSLCPPLSCCLYCNFHLLLIPPISTSHHQQFLFISPLRSLSPPHSPCLTAAAPHQSSRFPWHHRVFIITPQPSLGSLRSPLIFLVDPQISVSFPPPFTHFHPLITPSALLCFLNIAII